MRAVHQSLKTTNSGLRFPINRNFTLLWISGAISNIGDFVFDTTLIIWVVSELAHEQTWAPLAVSGIMLAVSLPTLIVRPFAGVLADRWDKRRLMLWMDAARAIIMLALSLASLAPLPTLTRLTAVYSAVIAASVCTQFFAPAQLSALGLVVSDAKRPRASSLQQLTTYLAIIAGPSIAGSLFFALGAPWALLVNAASFGFSWLAVRSIQLPSAWMTSAPRQRHAVVREMYDGLRLIAHNRTLRMVTLSLAAAMLGLGMLIALNVFFVTQTLQTPAALYGLLSGVFGVGSLIGAALAGRIIRWIGLSRAFSVAMVVVGVSVIIYSRMTSFSAALIIYGFVGVPNAINVVAYVPLTLRAAPQEFVARVNSIITPAYSAAMLFSETLAGYLASGPLHAFDMSALGSHLNAVTLLIGCGGAVVISAGLYAMTQHEVNSEAPVGALLDTQGAGSAASHYEGEG